MRTTALFTLLALPLGLQAADAKKKITYDDHVLPLLRDKCISCHSADKQRGGLDLSTYPKLMEGGGSGEVVKAGEPDGSRLYTLSAHTEEPKMPPNAPRVSDEMLNTLKAWIVQGALENSGSKAKPTKARSEVALTSITRGRPAGPPPMPEAKLRLDPVVVAPRPNAVIALAASPWAPLVAVGGQKQVLLYNTDTLQLVGILPFTPGTPVTLKFSRNGSLLLGAGGRGGQSGKVVVWNVKTGEVVTELGNETDCVMAADISPDQTLIALGGPSKMVRIYDLREGTQVAEIKKHTDWVTAMEFSPDGVLLATGDRAGGLHVWESANAREFYTLRAHTAAVTDVSWRDDSNVLASCSEDATIRLWEMENGSNFKNWGAHGGGAQSVKFTHDNRLVSVGRDRYARLWDQNGGQQRDFGQLPDVGLRVAAAHDMVRAVVTDWTGAVRVVSMADAKPAGELSANPKPIAEQLAAAEKDAAAKKAAFDQASAALAAAEAAAKKAVDEHAAAVALAAKLTTDSKAAADAANAAKGKLDQATAALSGAQMLAQAMQVKAQTLAEAAQKQKAAADANKANAALQQVAAQGAQLAEGAGKEMAAANSAVGPADAAQKAANGAYATAAGAAQSLQQQLAAAQQAVPAKQGVIAPTASAAAAAKPPVDAAKAALDAANAVVARLKGK